jgi:hypothetical protein
LIGPLNFLGLQGKTATIEAPNRGRINFNVRHTEEVLRSGDTLHLKADIPHRWRNAANRPAQLPIVWSPI